jgi:hypothetical protein
MKRLLSAMVSGLGPDSLDSLVSVIQDAFDGTPYLPDQAWMALDSTMTEFGLSTEARHSVHDVVHTPIHWENVLEDNQVKLASETLGTTEAIAPDLPSDWTQWQTWVVETMWTGWEFTLHIDRLGRVCISRPYLPDKAPSSSCLTVDLRSLLPASSLRADCPLSHQAVTVHESAAVRAMRQEDVRSIHVHLNDAGQPQRLDLEHERQAVRGHRLEELLSRDGFEDLTLKVQNGQIVHARHITKHKLA